VEDGKYNLFKYLASDDSLLQDEDGLFASVFQYLTCDPTSTRFHACNYKCSTCVKCHDSGSLIQMKPSSYWIMNEPSKKTVKKWSFDKKYLVRFHTAILSTCIINYVSMYRISSLQCTRQKMSSKNL
jgi:hypothetical protein